jgi:DNA-binding NarL/FixJ family response regulator
MLEWQAGRLSDACASLREAAARVESTGALPYAAFVLLDLAEVAAERGDVDLAAEATQSLKDVTARIDCDLYRSLAEMGTRRAVDLLAGSQWTLFRTRALERKGRSEIARNTTTAMQTLRDAAAAFDAAGCVWRRDRTRALLRSLGPRGRAAASAGSGASALSRRERQVARLAVQGLTALDVAERLSISERTVETHLANIYIKLGIRSKIDLVRRASEFFLNP